MILVAPVLTTDEPVDDMQAVQTIVNLEEDIEQEQLGDGVDDVDQFDHHIAWDEVIAVQFAADKAADLGYEMLDADYASSAVFALSQHISVHLIDHVSQRLHTHHHRKTMSSTCSSSFIVLSIHPSIFMPRNLCAA